MVGDTGERPAKPLSWHDGVVLALAALSALLSVVGHSIVALGGWGAALLWAISASLGSLQNLIYAEMAVMLPTRAGGMPIYAHEGWRRHSVLVGPVATFGYWFAWATVPALFGLAAGTLLQDIWPGTAGRVLIVGPVAITFPRAVAVATIAALWCLNLVGLRPAVTLSYLLAVLLVLPTVSLVALPYVTGQWSSVVVGWRLSPGGEVVDAVRPALTWLYLMGWASYAAEICAVVAPEYRDTTRDTVRAVRVSAAVMVTVALLLPIGMAGVLRTPVPPDAADSVTALALRAVLGEGSVVAILALVAGLILGMNSAMLDSSRALYGMSRAGLTLRWPGRLNRRRVPARALAVTLALDLVLVLSADSLVTIMAIGNLGYFLAHVSALTGFLLLRRERPDLPRPFHLPAAFVPIAAGLAGANVLFLVVGAFSFEITGYGTARQFGLAVLVLLLGVGLFLFRRMVEDGKPPPAPGSRDR